MSSSCIDTISTLKTPTHILSCENRFKLDKVRKDYKTLPPYSYVRGDNIARYDGLMGCNCAKESFQAQLKEVEVISANIVVFCFNKDPDRTSNPSGYMIFGQSKTLDNGFIWAPLTW